ncbi:MAG: glycan-binding surface protein [Bacteroides sp.]|nr:glycan-binding surface protein [Bacteroides sp.]
MNKKYKIWALWMMCLVVGSELTFTACSSDDDNDTNQYKGGISLNVFGPSPVARGGELRFLGSGMDRVTGIVLPGSGEITDIKVISDTEIRITVPQNAEEGLVVLKTPDGDITTITPITYMEPISLDDFSPKSAKAGEEITLTGEYLNLITEVIFADEVVVTEFVSQSRNEIVVVVPLEAQTGQLIISDGQEIPNWIYSEEDLEVTLPTIESISPVPLRAGDALTITGSDFYLVDKVILPGGFEVEIEDAEDVIVIEETPEDIQEGEIILVAKSGVEVASEPLELVKPEIGSISGTTVKNNTGFTITGMNLDLVSEVVFEGGEEGVSLTEFESQTATKLVLTLPAEAADGMFTLRTLSETETAGEALTFVKPSVSSLSATTVKANQELVLTGENLDLVTTVKFGEMAGKVVSATETTLTVTVPVGAESGSLTLLTDNGTEVITTQQVTVDVTLPDITSIEVEGPGGKITVRGTDLDIIKTIYLADEDGNYTIPVTDYGIKSATYLEFYHVLGAATGAITPLMVTVDGDEGYMPAFYCGGPDPIPDDAIMLFDFESGGSYDGDIWGAGSFETQSGNRYFRGSGSIPEWSFTWFFADNAGVRPEMNDLSGKVFKFDMKADQDFVPEWYYIQWVLGGSWGWCQSDHFPVDENGVCTTGGGWITVTLDFDVIGISEIGSGDFGLACQGSNFDWSNICIDNVRIENK